MTPAARPSRGRRGPAWLRSPIWFLAVLALAGVLLYPRMRAVVLEVEVTPVQRGHDVAVQLGCFNCHGPNGVGGVKNPGSEDGEVPGFIEGTLMMWVRSEEEIREYVLDGAPARKREDPRYRAQMESQLLAMPAYRDHLSGDELDDLMAYLRAVSGLLVPPDELAAKGQDLAYRLGCFHCHGPMGAGGGPNPGSFKGYIPGWWGNDFADLVRSDDELRAWILDGTIARLQEDFVGSHFLRNQRVYMPAYRAFITDEQLSALVAYVKWIHAGDWRGTPLDLAH
jgi:mono/diheme cytochrome c family protein